MQYPRCLLCRSNFSSANNIYASHSPRHLNHLASKLKQDSGERKSLTQYKEEVLRDLKFQDLKSFRRSLSHKNVILIYSDGIGQEPGSGRFAFWLAMGLSQLTVRGTDRKGNHFTRPASVMLIDDGVYTHCSRYLDDIFGKGLSYEYNPQSKHHKVSLTAMHKHMRVFLSRHGVQDLARLIDDWFLDFEEMASPGWNKDDWESERSHPIQIGPNLRYHELWAAECIARSIKTPHETTGVTLYMQHIEKMSATYDFVVFCKNRSPSYEVSTNDWLQFLPIKFILNPKFVKRKQNFSVAQELTNRSILIDSAQFSISDSELAERGCFFERFTVTPHAHLTENETATPCILAADSEFKTPREIAPALLYASRLLFDYKLIHPTQLNSFEKFVADFCEIARQFLRS